MGAALAVGSGDTVVTVSGGSAVATGGNDVAVGAGGGAAGVATAGRGVVGEMVVDTVPLSPPPRMTTVPTTATSRITPATPATQSHRRSSGSSS